MRGLGILWTDRDEGAVARLLLPLLLAALVAFTVGCTPNVGASCELSTDCGSTGQLVCDTSEYEGYCTMVDCLSDTCPDNAGCIEFYRSVAGCGIDDHLAMSRLSESFCMATCTSQSDCRVGYVCASPTESPWFAYILDDNQQELVCLPEPMTGETPGGMSQTLEPDAAVCQITGPGSTGYGLDGGFSSMDGAEQSSMESGVESGSDGSPEGD